MPQLLEAYWPYFLAALLIGIAVAWLLFVANRKTSVVGEDKKDVLDEGAAPAARNKALIDAPRAAEAPQAGETAPKMAAGPVTAPDHPARPAPAASPVPAPTESATASDDLTVIKGLGPKLATMLNGLGISTYAQIAAWSEADIDRIDAQLDRFKGRIRRDNWIEQAKLLAAGDTTGFSDRFGQNG